MCELEIEFSDGISIGLKSPGIPLDPFNPGRTADGEPEGKTGAVKWGEVRDIRLAFNIEFETFGEECSDWSSSSSSLKIVC